MLMISFWFLLIGCSSSEMDTWQPWTERVSLSLSGSVIQHIERTSVAENACVGVYDRGSIFMPAEPEQLTWTEVLSDGSWETEVIELKTQLGPIVAVEYCDAINGGEFLPSSMQIPVNLLQGTTAEKIQGLVIETISTTYAEALETAFLSVERPGFYPVEEGIFGRVYDPSHSPIQNAEVFCIDGFCDVFYQTDTATDTNLFHLESGELLQQTSSEGRYLMPGAGNNSYGVRSDAWNYDTLTSGSFYGVWHMQNYYPSSN